MVRNRHPKAQANKKISFCHSQETFKNLPVAHRLQLGAEHYEPLERFLNLRRGAEVRFFPEESSGKR